MRFIYLLVASLLSFSAAAGSPYKTQSVVLLQPQFVLEARVASIDSLSDYIKAVQVAAEHALADETPNPASGFIVLAVRPEGQSKAWLDFKPALPEATATRLVEAIQSVPPFPAKDGTVVFALNSSLWGAEPTTAFPNPREWSKAMEDREQPIEIGELVDKLVWPNEEAGPALPATTRH